MHQAKYVVINYPVPIGEVIYMFPDMITHAKFARHNAPERDIISAGFVMIRDNELFCHGESESLGKKSRPDEDGMLANIMFGRLK